MKVLSGIGALFVIALVGVVLFFAVPALLKWGTDVNREVTQHSQAYTQSMTQQLNMLITDYNDPDATSGQKSAIVNDFCYKITLLLPGERPTNVLRFAQEHC